ncbi:hypothetical protein CISIN_1g046650mg [Citrus sinensis]|uniref:Uncharacterized protein n=1 Tax=Citrus sinensis TaxID=2711 RepID=A0A067F7A8_CITSI|nr:hypothetical protein CISIN_1g046650mg [Citrus sinensis]
MGLSAKLSMAAELFASMLESHQVSSALEPGLRIIRPISSAFLLSLKINNNNNKIFNRIVFISGIWNLQKITKKINKQESHASYT